MEHNSINYVKNIEDSAKTADNYSLAITACGILTFLKFGVDYATKGIIPNIDAYTSLGVAFGTSVLLHEVSENYLKLAKFYKNK